MKNFCFVVALVLLGASLAPRAIGAFFQLPTPNSNRWDSGTGPTTLPSSATTVTLYTTRLQLLRCNNVTSSAATLTITDATSNKDLETAFSLPANSERDVINNPVGVIVGGFKWSSGTSSAINCYATGTQN